MKFSEILGLSELSQTLAGVAQSDRMAHALQFAGQEGGRQLSMALALATFLHCESVEGLDSCGTCSSCKKHAKGIHPDLHYFFPLPSGMKREEAMPIWRKSLLDGPFLSSNSWNMALQAENKALNFSVTSSREVASVLSYKSVEGKYTIVLLFLPEFMQASAANAILKILEEPPAQTIFLLVTERIEKLLPTILSRCQTYIIPPTQEEEMRAYLGEQGYSSEKIEAACLQSEGNMCLAIELCKGEDADYQSFTEEFLRHSYVAGFESLLQLSELFASMNKESQKRQIQHILSILRETLFFREEVQQPKEGMPSQKVFAAKFSAAIQWEQMNSIREYLEALSFELERNANAKMAFLNFCIRSSKVLRKA